MVLFLVLLPKIIAVLEHYRTCMICKFTAGTSDVLFFHLKALKSTISKTFVREKEIPISQLCNCITFKVVSLRSDVRDGPKNLRTCFGSDFNKSPTDLVTEMFLNLKHKTAMKMWKKKQSIGSRDLSPFTS